MASAAIVTARRIGQAGGIAVSGAVFTAAAGVNLVAAGEGSPLRALAIVDGLEAGLLLSAAVVASAIAVYWRWGRTEGRGLGYHLLPRGDGRVSRAPIRSPLPGGEG